ncbi:hypothetical protein [Actinomadura macrotermitis]|uniref:Uncharacterized protein n=1 Tax=Actinomadura macrotermitis TaxID=2585200 RepID=A0A7K0BXY1_9ACTN|nr:hypothetical protein [Actinomadura macrotermitis]MQY06029.1 hypothetical protein [Actinomadura macrotermitis]
MAYALIAFVLIGVWLFLARPARVPFTGNAAGPSSGGPKGPDDDPDFLRDLDRRLRGD